jgi:hypothetical protein
MILRIFGLTQMTIAQVEDLRKRLTPADFEARMKLGIDNKDVTKDDDLLQKVMLCTQSVHKAQTYVKIRQALCDHDEWLLLVRLFKVIAKGDILNDKVRTYTIVRYQYTNPMCLQTGAALKKYHEKLELGAKKKKSRGRGGSKKADTVPDTKIPVPDVPTGKWEAHMWAKLHKPVRMRYYQELIDGNKDWYQVWKDIDKAKKWGVTLDYIRLALDLEQHADVSPLLHLLIHHQYI